MKLVQVPCEDLSWFTCALYDALQGKQQLVPLGEGCAPLSESEITAVPAETAVVIRTSGSSGHPKAVALSATALIANAHASHEALGGAGQWLIALPLNFMGGLGQLVRSFVADTTPEFALGFDARKLLIHSEKLTHARRYLSVVPQQLQQILSLAAESSYFADLATSFSAILVGGGPVSLAVRQQAWELGLNLVRTYGATETAGGCVYDGVEIGDTRVRIREGEVQLTGSNLALGYVGDPVLNAAKFQGTGADRWYLTGDSGRLLGGMLEVTGRLDRVFISGGVNVSLDRIEGLLADCLSGYGVSAFCAVAVPDQKWGQRAALVYVGADPLTVAQQQEIKDLLRSQIGAAAVPQDFIHSGNSLLLPGGKIDLQAAADLAILRG